MLQRIRRPMTVERLERAFQFGLTKVVNCKLWRQMVMGVGARLWSLQQKLADLEKMLQSDPNALKPMGVIHMPIKEPRAFIHSTY